LRINLVRQSSYYGRAAEEIRRDNTNKEEEEASMIRGKTSLACQPGMKRTIVGR